MNVKQLREALENLPEDRQVVAFDGDFVDFIILKPEEDMYGEIVTAVCLMK